LGALLVAVHDQLAGVTNIHVWVNEVVSFTMYDTGEMRKEFTGKWLGVVRPKLE